MRRAARGCKGPEVRESSVGVKFKGRVMVRQGLLEQRDALLVHDSSEDLVDGDEETAVRRRCRWVSLVLTVGLDHGFRDVAGDEVELLTCLHDLGAVFQFRTEAGDGARQTVLGVDVVEGGFEGREAVKLVWKSTGPRGKGGHGVDLAARKKRAIVREDVANGGAVQAERLHEGSAVRRK